MSRPVLGVSPLAAEEPPTRRPPWVGVLAAVLGAVFVVVALFVYQIIRMGHAGNLAEAKVGAAAIARGIAACAMREDDSGHAHGLPPSSRRVPESLSSVDLAHPYRSTPSEWTDDEAFACARLSMPDKQRFQYQWTRIDDHRGIAVARGDADGDGVEDVRVEIAVSCRSANEEETCVPSTVNVFGGD